MAKVMSYTDPGTHAVYPESTWIPLIVAPDFASAPPIGTVVFLGYATKAVAAAKLKYALGQPGGQDAMPIGSKRYTVPAAALQAYALGAPTGPTRIDDDSGIAYDVAANTLDTDPVTRLPSAARGAVSFFQGSADADLLAG
jgi:hypothetical protein